MVKPQRRVHFAGLDGGSDASLPDYYKNEYGITEEDTVPFSHAIRAEPEDGGLYSAQTTGFAWKVPHGQDLNPAVVGELEEQAPDGVDVFRSEDGHLWVRTSRYNATYSPEKVQNWLDGKFDYDEGEMSGQTDAFIDPLWQPATETYAVINPADGYGPLEDAIREFGLGDDLYGNFRLYKQGGAFYLDAMFDADEATLDIDGDPLKIGFSSGGDFFGNRSFFAEGFAQDTHCTNSMRRLTNRLTRRHVSPKGQTGLDAKQFDEWWSYLIRQALGVKSELEEAIEDAQDTTLDLTDLPFDLEEFFDLYGFPARDFAPTAKIYAESRAEDKWHPTMWDLHSGCTAVLEHEWDHTEGSQFNRYVRMANDLLFNPHMSVTQVENEYERRLQAERGDGEDQQTIEGESGLAQIESLRDDLAEQADEWEDRQDRLNEMMESPEEGEDIDVEATLEML